MSAPAPINEPEPMNVIITNDLKIEFKNILIKYLDDRIFKEDKINSWMNEILKDAKEYFIKKYPDYDIFLHCYICSKTVYFSSKVSSISINDIDWSDCVTFYTDNLFSTIYFFFFKHYDLNYSLEEFENQIIQKGNELLEKYLDGRKYDKDQVTTYNNNIINEHSEYIVEKNNQLRAMLLSEIYQKPLQGKYFFKYLVHGKNICSKIIQTYTTDNLTCCHYIFFFK